VTPPDPDAPDLATYLNGLRETIESALDRVLVAGDGPGVINEAVRYAVLDGGKRLRPCLSLATAETAGARLGLDVARAHALALPAACAVEMVHSYSLVHDDLPAMDDDSLRRGRPTTHVVYGDGLAILAGDGLLTEAFGVLAASPSPATRPDAPQAAPERRLEAVRVLARAAGTEGMVGGQAVDLAAAGRVVDRTTPIRDATALEDMHRRKTGALIRAAVTTAAIVTGADSTTVAAADAYARDLGLAFQIIDDVLDVEGSPEALGKTAGKDAAAGKPTYPALFGIEQSRRLAAEAVGRAVAALEDAGLGGRLIEIAEWSLTRRT
jgi:geranylgeranyl pyrophosphate synthase